MTAKKTAEILGSGVTTALEFGELKKQNLKHGSECRGHAIEGCLGSKGATEAIRGYNDNDITSNLVNGKHTNPTLYSQKKPVAKAKASS